MRVKILMVDPSDGYWEQRKDVVGLVGELDIAKDHGNGWYGGILMFDQITTVARVPRRGLAVWKMKVQVVEGTPATSKHVGFWGFLWQVLNKGILSNSSRKNVNTTNKDQIK